MLVRVPATKSDPEVGIPWRASDTVDFMSFQELADNISFSLAQRHIAFELIE